MSRSKCIRVLLISVRYSDLEKELIFATVGTHEQQFDRLIRALDNYASLHKDEEVHIQTGFCTYHPANCKSTAFMAYEDIARHMKQSDVVICHGGPSTFMEALMEGKVPVVVPREARFGEHVNDHQKEFVIRVAESGLNIIPVLDINELPKAIGEARSKIDICTFDSNNARFCSELHAIIGRL